MECMENHPNYKVEMGVLYFCDSLAKTDIFINASTDEDIILQSENITKIVASKGLHQNIVNTVKQIPINISLVHTYLKLI